METLPGEGWEALLKDLIQHEGTAILMGESDAGKSTLGRFLISEFLERKRPVCFVDADIGQSSLGVPGTIAKKIFRRPAALRDFSARQMLCAGVMNPARRIGFMIDGTKAMVEDCKKRGVRMVLIDTTGLVRGGLGKALKLGKIRAVKPRHLIAIEKKDELEHILREVRGARIHRLRPSPLAKKRSPAMRAEYRERKFREYFSRAHILYAPVSRFEFSHLGEPFSPEEAPPRRGTLLALNQNGRTAALGTFTGMAGDKIAVKTPLRSLEKINGINFGDMPL